MLFNAGGVVESVCLPFLMNLHSTVAASDATSIVVSVVMVFGLVFVFSLFCAVLSAIQCGSCCRDFILVIPHE